MVRANLLLVWCSGYGMGHENKNLGDVKFHVTVTSLLGTSAYMTAYCCTFTRIQQQPGWL